MKDIQKDRLVVEGLEMRFQSGNRDVIALQNVSLKVQRREFVCVVGASGCGKSTMIRLVAGLETPTSGEIRIDGRAVRGPGRDRGMVFQSYTLFPWLSVKDNILFGPKMSGRGGAALEGEALQWMEMVGLSQFADSYPHELSGGMRQRVAIARALANDPDVLLMDEPFAALDAQTRSQMQRHLIQIWKNVDVTILFVTHDLDEAIYLSDRIVVMVPGPGRIAEVIENPVPRPRSKKQLTSPVFQEMKRKLESWIHPEGTENEEDDLPIIPLVHKSLKRE